MSTDAFTPRREAALRAEDPSEARAAAARRRARRPYGKYVLNTLAMLITVFWIFPIYWMFLISVRPLTDAYSQHPSFLPKPFSLSNYSDVVHDPQFWNSLKNSSIVVFAAVLISVLIGFLAAVAIARFKFRARRAMIVMVMIVQMIPLGSVIVPLYFIYTKIGLNENLLGLVIAYLALTLPFCVWTLRGFVAGVPVELEEAAMVDGCSRFGAFFRIILPLVVPGLVSTAIYTLIQGWNEFQLTNFMINQNDHFTVSLYLNNFLGVNRQVQYGDVMATAILMALPVVILFMLVQRKVASGMTAGAVKG